MKIENFWKQCLLPYLVTVNDVIKWQNVRKLFFNALALPRTTSNKKSSLVYLMYLNLLKDHFGGRIWVSPEPAVPTLILDG